MSQTSSHTLESYRMRCFLQVVIFRVCTERPKLGIFTNFSKYSVFCCFITQLVKKLQQWSLSQVIKDILPFVLNTKWPLSDIWLLRYKQNSFGCFFNLFKIQRFLLLYFLACKKATPMGFRCASISRNTLYTGHLLT